MLFLLSQNFRKKGYNLVNTLLPHLLTYPRSGSHYFDDLIYEEKKLHFNKSHYLDQLFDKNNNKNRTIITIARDPKDSISSYLALFRLHEPGNEHIISEKITEYILMYSFLYEHADYVIDFNDLVNNPKPVIEKVLNFISIEEDDYHRFNTDAVSKFKGFIPSSKPLASYNDKVLDGFNLDLCYFYYNKLLEKKITV